MLKHVARLSQGNAGKPLDELVNGRILFEILEKCGNRHPRAAENPGTTYAFRVAFDIGAGRPIDHGGGQACTGWTTNLTPSAAQTRDTVSKRGWALGRSAL